MPRREPLPGDVADAQPPTNGRQPLQAGGQVGEVGRVDDQPIAEVDEALEHRIAEWRVARPPHLDRQVVDDERRDDAVEVAGRLPRTVRASCSKQIRPAPVSPSRQCVPMRASIRSPSESGSAWSTMARDGWRVPSSRGSRDTLALRSIADRHDEVQDRGPGLGCSLFGDDDAVRAPVRAVQAAVRGAASRCLVPDASQLRLDRPNGRAAHFPERRRGGQVPVHGRRHSRPSRANRLIGGWRSPAAGRVKVEGPPAARCTCRR